MDYIYRWDNYRNRVMTITTHTSKGVVMTIVHLSETKNHRFNKSPIIIYETTKEKGEVLLVVKSWIVSKKKRIQSYSLSLSRKSYTMKRFKVINWCRYKYKHHFYHLTPDKAI